MAKDNPFQKQNIFIQQNDLFYSVNAYLGSNRQTHFKTNKQKIAQYNMNLQLIKVFSFYLAPSNGEIKDALVHFNLKVDRSNPATLNFLKRE